MTEAVIDYRPAFRVIPVITNEDEHDAVLAEIDALMDLEPAKNSTGGVRLRLLAKLAAEFEQERYPIEPLTPPETIAFAMERHGITREQIGALIGGASRVADLLNARRRITNVDQLRALAAFLRVPFELLTLHYETTEPKARTVAAKAVAPKSYRSGKTVSFGTFQTAAAKKSRKQSFTGKRSGDSGGLSLAASKRGRKTTA